MEVPGLRRSFDRQSSGVEGGGGGDAGQQSVLRRAEHLADSVDRKLHSIKGGAGGSVSQDSAKHIALVLRELRTYIYVDNRVLFHLYGIGFVDKLVAGLIRSFEFRVLFNELLRCIIGFLRNPSVCVQVQDRLLHYEITKVLFLALRRHSDDDNTKVQCVEMLDNIVARSRERCSEAEARNLCVFMVSNGCIEVFPKLIDDFAVHSRTVCLLRIMESLVFFVRNAPDSAISRLLAAGMARPLIALGLSNNQTVKIKAVTALIGLVVASAEVAAMVHKELGWEDICYLSIHDDDVPSEWADGVLVRMHELGVPLESVKSLQHAPIPSDSELSEEDGEESGFVFIDEGENRHVYLGHEESGSMESEHDAAQRRGTSDPARQSRGTAPEIDNRSPTRGKSGYEKTQPFLYETLMEGPYSYAIPEKERKKILSKSKKITEESRRPKTNEYVRSSQPRDGKNADKKPGSARPRIISPSNRAPEAFGRGNASGKDTKERGGGRPKTAPKSQPILVPIKVPVGFEGVAEKIFETEIQSNNDEHTEHPSSSDIAQDRDEAMDDAGSALKKLSYAEKLQMMIMAVQEKL